MGEFSPLHWLMVLVVIVILFGPKRLPEIARALGKGIREFKDAFRDVSTDSRDEKRPTTLEPIPAESNLPKQQL